MYDVIQTDGHIPNPYRRETDDPLTSPRIGLYTTCLGKPAIYLDH